MGARGKGKRVSRKTRDSWELTGSRTGTIKVVDLTTGEKGSARFIVDASKNEYKIQCRRCGEWGTYLLTSITDNQRSSGLCPDCFARENQSNVYAFGQTLEGKWEQIPLSGKEESWILSDSEIDRIKELLYPDTDLRLVKCPPDPFEKAEELLFLGEDSDYARTIQNKKIRHYIAKVRAFEKWKTTYPEECVKLLSWSDDEVSENRFVEMYPDARSPTGKKITTSFLQSMREHCSRSKSKVVSDWQGFEFSVRDLISRWDQLDPRRYLIFKLDLRKFCYREIDALGIGTNAKVIVDAKWVGGEIKKSQMELYVKFLREVGIEVTRGVFVTADDEFEDLGNDIFRMPLDWFTLLKSIDRVDIFIRRLLQMRKKSARVS